MKAFEGGLVGIILILIGCLGCVLCVEWQKDYNNKLAIEKLEKRLDIQQKELDFCKRTQSIMQSEWAEYSGVYDKK